MRMAENNRLDFIENIDPIEITRMTDIRSKFIELDKELQKISDDLFERKRMDDGLRVISLARTQLEVSLQFSIKSLCILGEIK